jgi:ABC-type multidrug transport system ATPase subunit
VTVSELRGEGLRLSAGGRLLLEGFDVHASAGEVVGIGGPSGSGKTTLILTLAGLSEPDAGRVTVDGEEVQPWKAVSLAIVTQTIRVVPVLTVKETVAVPLQATRMEAADMEERVAAALEDVGLTGMADQLVSTLSGGQRQRLLIAQAVGRQPDILLADEPCAALDGEWRDKVLTRLWEVARAGSIVMIASNDTETLGICDRMVSTGAAV